MQKLLFLVFGVGIIGISAAQAMPFHAAQARLTILVGGGCGIGVHRGPYDGCEPVYGGYYGNYYAGYSRGYYHGYRNGYSDGYHDGYYDGAGPSLVVDQGACSGRGMRRVCNIYGICWIACY